MYEIFPSREENEAIFRWYQSEDNYEVVNEGGVIKKQIILMFILLRMAYIIQQIIQISKKEYVMKIITNGSMLRKIRN